MTQFSTASAFLAQVTGCAFLAVLLAIAAWRFRRAWLVAWSGLFALAAVGVWAASLYFAGRGRILVSVYSLLVVAASLLLLWGLLRFIDSPRWSGWVARLAGPFLILIFAAAAVLQPLTWFSVLSVIQAFFMAFTGIILVASVSPSWGRGMTIVGCLVQIGSHLFYLSSQVAGLGYTDLYRYGLTADLLAELLIGFGLLLLAWNREKQTSRPARPEPDVPSGTFARHETATASPPKSLEEWFAEWDERDPTAILAVGIESALAGREAFSAPLGAVAEVLEELTKPGGVVARGDQHTLTAVISAACLRDARALEHLIRTVRLLSEPLDPHKPPHYQIHWGISLCRRRDLAQEAIQVAHRRMLEKFAERPAFEP